MRIVKEINVEEFKVTVYHWNNKYILKYENGWHEITVKISQLDINTESDLDIFLSDSEILWKIKEAFEKLNETMATFYSKI